MPAASITGRPAPIAPAIGSSIRNEERAPAATAASCTARFSTSVAPEGMPITTRGFGIPSPKRSCTERMKYCSIRSVTAKSEITPSRSGRTATIVEGVRPTISFASSPIASTRFDIVSIATTEGSSITIPRPRTLTSVFAVPRSMPTSCEKIPEE